MFSVKETNYKTLRIPYGKTKINGEFNYISGIDTVIIPASVTEISASFKFSSVKKVIFENNRIVFRLLFHTFATIKKNANL